MNPKTTDTKVEETITLLCSGKTTVEEAVNSLLGESVTAGQSVAVIGDPTYPFDGVKGKVKSLSGEGGYAEVEFPNGTIAKLQSSLLIPV